jgi:hypothetical protein
MSLDSYFYVEVVDLELVKEPLDRTFGRGRFEIERAAPEARVSVTFRASVSEPLGEPRAAAFRGLRAYGADPELRVLSNHS